MKTFLKGYVVLMSFAVPLAAQSYYDVFTQGMSAAMSKDDHSTMIYMQRALNLCQGQTSPACSDLERHMIIIELAGAERGIAKESPISEQQDWLMRSAGHYREGIALDPDAKKDPDYIYAKLLEDVEWELFYAHQKLQPVQRAVIPPKDRSKQLEQAAKKGKNPKLPAEVTNCENGQAVVPIRDGKRLRTELTGCFDVSRSLITAGFTELAKEFYSRGVVLDPTLPDRNYDPRTTWEAFYAYQVGRDEENRVRDQENRRRNTDALLNGLQRGLEGAADEMAKAEAIKTQTRQTVESSRPAPAPTISTSGGLTTTVPQVPKFPDTLPPAPVSSRASSASNSSSGMSSSMGSGSCQSMNSAVSVQAGRVTGAGHCADEVVITIVNNTSERLVCTYAYHKGGQWTENGTVGVGANARLSGELAGLWTCGADDARVQYACFTRSEEMAKSCSANVDWKR
jgi:hypothetical protein